MKMKLDGYCIRLLSQYVQSSRQQDKHRILIAFDLHFDDLKEGRVRRVVMPRYITIEVDPALAEPVFYQALHRFGELVI